MEQNLLELLGKFILYSTGAAAIAIGILKLFGKKWIENKFAEKLEEYKRIQAQELEEYKFKINALFNRITKIHEKEIEVLPEAWKKLNHSLGLVSQLVALMRFYPNINGMSPAKLDEFLGKSSLFNHEKQELREADDKQKYYQEKIFWHELAETKQAFADFHNFISGNSIFLGSDLRGEFTKIDELMWQAINDMEYGHEDGDRKLWVEAYKKIRDDSKPIVLSIEELVQAKLNFGKAD